MTSSIPTPFPSTTSGSDGSPSASSLDNLMSAFNGSSQGGTAYPSAGGDFGTLLDSSTNQAAQGSQSVAPVSAQAADADTTDLSVPVSGTKDASTPPAKAQGKPSPAASAAGSARDLAEAVASMLSPLWAQPLAPLPQTLHPQGPANGALDGSSSSLDSGTALGTATAVAAKAAGAAASCLGSGAVSGVYGEIAAAMAAESGQTSPKLPSGAPGSGSKGEKATLQVSEGEADGTLATSVSATGSVPIPGLSRYAEKFAASAGAAATGSIRVQAAAQKNFLTTGDQEVKSSGQRDGIGIAKTSSNMPAAYTTSLQMAGNPGAVTAAGTPTVTTQVGSAPPPATLPTAPSPITPTLAPVLAMRAVETVLNVVDAQQVTAGSAGSVKLDFNFGGQALAVHVQMRGGEVHTEFRTNSAELRSALSSEWNSASGQRDAQGIRLVEPVFSSGESGSSTSNGSLANGNFSSQGQNPQQQSTAASQSTLARANRSSVASPSDESQDTAFSPASIHPTSLHLAAVA